MRAWLTLVTWVGLALSPKVGEAFEVPPLLNHVNDRAQVIPASDEEGLNQTLARIKKETGLEMAILTLKTLDGLAVEEASIRIVDQWKLGTAKEDRGVLLLLALEERKVRIEVGQGLEGDLTDAKSRRIIDEILLPALRQGQFAKAFWQGSFAILQTALPDRDVAADFADRPLATVPQVPEEIRLGQLGSLFFLLFLLFILSRTGALPYLLVAGSHRGSGFPGSGGFGRSGGGFGGGLGGGGGFSGGGASGGW